MDGKHLRETPAAAAAICRAFASCWVEARGRGFNAQNLPPSEHAACRPEVGCAIRRRQRADI